MTAQFPQPTGTILTRNATLGLVVVGTAALLASCIVGAGIGVAGAGSPVASASASPWASASPSASASPVFVTVTVAPPAVAPLVGLPPVKAPVKPAAPKPAAPKPAPEPEPEPASAYYGNCAAARAAGAAPLYVGDPGYRAGLDRDGDGVACE